MRRVLRVQISHALLERWLQAEQFEAQVVAVGQSFDDKLMKRFDVVLESDKFRPIPDGEEVPLAMITVERVKATIEELK